MTSTEVTENITTRQSLNQFVKNLVRDRCCLGLLRFFGTHPNSRFSKLAVVHAIDENNSKLKLERALTQLIDEGLVKTNLENNTRLYLLTKNEPVRRLVIELAKLDWSQWQTVVGHI